MGAHPYIGHLHTRNHTFVISGRGFRTTNNTDGHGFRNTWPWAGVVVGDSFTFGHGVAYDEAWPAMLARKIPSPRVIISG